MDACVCLYVYRESEASVMYWSSVHMDACVCIGMDWS
jgi:hypothetical protein